MIRRALPHSGERNSPGKIEICDLGPRTLVSSRDPAVQVTIQQQRYLYTAPSDVSLGDFNQFSFYVTVDSDGNRRFGPDSSIGRNGFVPLAFQIGHSLLARDRNWDREVWEEFLFAKLLCDGRAQERIRRNFRTKSDLAVRRCVGNTGRPDILPLDLATDGEDDSIDCFWSEGRQAAVEAGIKRPNGETIVAHRLLQAALNSPARPDPSSAESSIRMALYDLAGKSVDVPAEIHQEVWERFKLRNRQHLPDSRDAYINWARGPKCNVRKSVARLAGRPHGALDAEVVRRSLLEHRWRCEKMMAECLGKFAESFRAAVGGRWTESEEEQFQQMYYPQACFGGLTLHMLWDRSAILKPILPRIWTSPGDTNLIEAMHRILNYYAAMVTERRATDTLRASRKARKHADVQKADESRIVAKSDSTYEELRQLYDHYLETKKTKCPECQTTLRADVTRCQIRDDGKVQIVGLCDRHGSQKTINITIEKIQKTVGDDFRCDRPLKSISQE